MLFGRQKFSSSDVGTQAERLAEQYLLRQGLRLVERNYRCRLGEIDLVMQEGDCWVFVEVRSRRNSAFGSALESVGVSKQRKIIAAAQHFAAKRRLPGDQPMRFDVVGVNPGHEGDPVQWIAHAFYGE